MARRISALLLGAWLAGTILIAAMAVVNFRMADRLLDPSLSAATDRGFGSILAQLPSHEARLALRHLASELNRASFQWWGWVELGLAAALAVIMARARMERRLLLPLLGMAAIVAATIFFITPEIVEVGRSIEFVPRDPVPPEMAPQMSRFGRLHAAYSILDLIKLGLGAWLAVMLIRSKTG